MTTRDWLVLIGITSGFILACAVTWIAYRRQRQGQAEALEQQYRASLKDRVLYWINDSESKQLSEAEIQAWIHTDPKDVLAAIQDLVAEGRIHEVPSGTKMYALSTER